MERGYDCDERGGLANDGGKRKETVTICMWIESSWLARRSECVERYVGTAKKASPRAELASRC